MLTTPRACGQYDGDVVLEPSNGAAEVTTSLPITIDQDCIDPATFAPTIGVTTSSSQAGATGAVTTISIVRPDRGARLARLDADLPPGVLADLNGVASCTDAQLAAAACPASSRIGGVRATVGVGPAPLTTGGDVFLMDPPAGAAAGVGIQAPVKFGDVDLGMLTMTAPHRPAPDRLRAALQRRRPRSLPRVPARDPPARRRARSSGFGKNPTSCDALMARGGALRSDLGLTANVEVPLQYDGCGRLAFSPTIATKLTGDLTIASRPAVDVRLEVPGGNAAIRRAKVILPAGSRPTSRCPSVPAPRPPGSPGSAALRPRWWARRGHGRDPARGAPRARVAREGARQRAPRHRRAVHRSIRVARIVGRLTTSSKTGELLAEFPSVPDVPLTRMETSAS